MISALPPEIVDALASSGKCNSVANVTRSGGSAFSTTLKVVGDKGHSFFIKKSNETDAEAMFRGEFHSLKAISDALPGFCPLPIAHGQLAPSHSSRGAYIAMSYLNLSSRSSPALQRAFGSRLAQMHDATSAKGQFGFDVATYCGPTEQDNTWTDDWVEFYKARRLQPMFDRLRHDNELVSLGTKLLHLIDALFPPQVHAAIKPSLVHGDLWSGNYGVDKDTGEPVLFDPASCYGHAESELGMMRMFGGFSEACLAAYHAHHPPVQPFHATRVKLYELYHHLNHYVLFGSGYRSGCMELMREVVSVAQTGRE
ncbi:Ketosamine-3-kinase [Gonapodya prolifera JEL478]|uniref:protein-ribulosamine 3-kinase n=1 Tax=Gonapodya prolifera (strain JEL478) TaxID=1344416 RepID=A0A139AKF3_GONPJ|nr:Ketosamine-3-kinase [Gonapodya prolifera JEL478]|eukprot:KXS17256.1 Ketosamine-3-kinase [Gonapodya prolifera JEL478]